MKSKLKKSGKNFIILRSGFSLWLFNRYNEIKYNAKLIFKNIFTNGTIRLLVEANN